MSRIVGYAPGAYDLFHVGHVNLLRHARSQCDYLVAGVVSDEKCERTKGGRPFVPLMERAEIVRSIAFVDEVYEEHVVLDGGHCTVKLQVLNGWSETATVKDNKFGPNRVIKNCQLQVYTAVHLTASGNVMELTGAAVSPLRDNS